MAKAIAPSPYFATVSPTCNPGGKEAAWKLFQAGGYIAIGWCYKKDLTGMSIEEILKLVRRTSDNERDEQDGLSSFPDFWKLCDRAARGCQDYVAVKNVNHGLFGVGVVRSGYKYSRYKHKTGVRGHFYPHYVEVEWLRTEYVSAKSLVFGGEAAWRPYGTLQLYPSLPSYILPYTRRGN